MESLEAACLFQTASFSGKREESDVATVNDQMFAIVHPLLVDKAKKTISSAQW